MAGMRTGGRRTPTKSQRNKPKLEKLLAQSQRIEAKDLVKGDLFEPNEISGVLRVIGPSKMNGREVILARTNDALRREFFLPSTAIVKLVGQG